MKTRRPTAAGVAELAGVSKWTVIRAFDHGASISAETRKKVRAAAATLGYRPNLLARSLATNQTNQVAVFIDDFNNPHKLPAIAQLSLALQEEGKILIVVNINRQFKQLDALIHAQQRQLDGVILFANSLQDKIIEEARAGNIPVPLVILARESTLRSVPSVTTTTKASMIEIGTYLRERGYRKPGYMTGPSARSSLVLRHRYFEEFWRSGHSGPMPVLAADSYDRHDAEIAMRNYLETSKKADRIDVLLCENDALAFGAMDIARKIFGLRVPEDMAFVGYDDVDLAASPSYGLTTYRQPLARMIKTALDILANRRNRRSTEIKGQLVVREST